MALQTPSPSPFKPREIDHGIDLHVRGRDNTDTTLCPVIYLSTCDKMIDSRRGFLSGSSGLPIHQNYKSVHENESVCADKWTLSESV